MVNACLVVSIYQLLQDANQVMSITRTPLLSGKWKRHQLVKLPNPFDSEGHVHAAVFLKCFCVALETWSVLILKLRAQNFAYVFKQNLYEVK